MIGKRRRSNGGNTWVYRRAHHGRKINDRCRYDIREARWLEKKKGKNIVRAFYEEKTGR